MRGEESTREHELGELYEQLREIDRTDERLIKQLRHVKAYQGLIHSTERENGTSSEDSAMKFSKSFIDEQHGILSSCQAIQNGYRETLRTDINQRSRAALRQLTILDMPDEILVRVFEEVRGRDIDLMHYGILFLRDASDIKNLRLTCWRFWNTSSHLLLRYVRVELNQASLDRLDTISKHPTISKGVRIVRIVLDYFDYELADSLELFAEHSAAKLDDYADMVERMATHESGAVGENEIEAIRNVRQFRKWCLRVAHAAGEMGFEAKPSHRKLLHKAHEEYQSRVTAQHQLLEGRAFVRSVAAALGRMPLAARLEYQEHDFQSSHWRRTSPLLVGEDSDLLWQMLHPMTWDEGREWGLSTPHVNLLAVLPGALYQAGAVLKSLVVNLSSLPESYDILTTAEADSLSMSVQHLKQVQIELRGFRMANDAEYTLDLAEVEYFRRYIDALLSTDSIEKIYLDLSCLSNQERPPLTDLGSLMTFRTWENLKIVSWRGVPLHQVDLERFLQQLRKPLLDLTLCSVHLLSGSWAEVLEILRRAPTGCRTSLSNPRGAECEELSVEEQSRVFDKPKDDRIWGNSQAEEYIEGYLDHNPLKPVE
ncbi:MAG: hypothetical protein Q9169_003156 [Polycauliona sp. 2 TL-2023]